METLKAVHTNDVGKYLNSLGVLEGVKNGQKNCSICGKQISLSDFSAIYPKDGEICFVCDSIDCYDTILNSNHR